MEKGVKLFARILAANDGKVYIILKNFYCCILSAESLCSLLENPSEFIIKNARIFASKYAYPARLTGLLSDIPGLTLGYLTEERKFVCEHPEMICAAIQHAKKADSKSQINISEVLIDGQVLDKKQLCIKLFLALGSKNGNNILNTNFSLDKETETHIISEILKNQFFNKPIDIHFFDKKEEAESESVVTDDIATTATVNLTEISDEDSDLPFTLCNLPTPPDSAPPRKYYMKDHAKDDCIPSHFICTNELAKKYKVDPVFVRKLNRDGKIHGLKDNLGKYWFDPKTVIEKPVDRRKLKKSGSTLRGPVKPPRGASYEEVQRYIQENGYFSDAVRPYIRTMKELDYYLNNKYREVDWYGNIALIIEVDLGYYSEKYKATNRELIIAGESPVVPNLDVKYDLHHIGQRKDSPLAIIPSNIHNGHETYSIFHSGDSDDNLHNAAFAIRKQQFWSIYVHLCDEYRRYENIPYVSENKRKH